VLAVLVVSTMLLVACSGTPTPPVKKLIDLDKLVTNNMTLDQVRAIMTPQLQITGTIYPATRVELQSDGSWVINYRESDLAAGETPQYKVYLFPPSSAVPNNYFTIFFKNDVVFGKSWFDLQGGIVAESNLKGTK